MGTGAMQMEGSGDTKVAPLPPPPALSPHPHPQMRTECVLSPSACGSAPATTRWAASAALCPSGFDFDQALEAARTDECAARRGPCSYSCANTPGGFPRAAALEATSGLGKGEGLQWRNPEAPHTPECTHTRWPTCRPVYTCMLRNGAEAQQHLWMCIHSLQPTVVCHCPAHLHVLSANILLECA